MDKDTTLRDLQDRLDIIEICTLNHWYIDRRMWDALDGVLHDTVSMPTLEEIASDPTFDVGTYLGRYVRTREQITTGIRGFLDGMTTQHLIAGHQVLLRGDEATCVAHSINVHIPDGTGEAMLLHGNEYRFDLLRTPGGWRINGWLSTIRWSKGDESFHDVSTKQRTWVESTEAHR